MKLETGALIDAIDRYIAKADNDLEEQLSAEGYVGAKKAIELANELEEAIDNVLEKDSLAFLDLVKSETDVKTLIKDAWPSFQTSEELKSALYEVFREIFNNMLRSFTCEWMLAENPVLAMVDEEITRPAEDFIIGWSDELARIMHLNTKDMMEKLLLKAQENEWSIDELAKAIGDSGIRNHGYRSRTVALTEMLRVESYAQQEAMIQNPLAYKKKWKHVMSANPRENHMAMDEEEVFKRDMFALTGRDGGTYYVMCPRDTSLPASETINCHCLMETVANEKAIPLTDEEMVSIRRKYMDEVNAEYEEWEQKFKDDYGIEKPRDNPSVTWEMYNSYYEEYRRGVA